MAAIDPSTLETLKATHGEVFECANPDDPEFAVYVRRVKRAEYKRFKAMSADAATRAGAVSQLVRDCLVHPDAASYEAILDARPALEDVVAARVLELAGLSDKVDAKKR